MYRNFYSCIGITVPFAAIHLVSCIVSEANYLGYHSESDHPATIVFPPASMRE